MGFKTKIDPPKPEDRIVIIIFIKIFSLLEKQRAY